MARSREHYIAWIAEDVGDDEKGPVALGLFSGHLEPFGEHEDDDSPELEEMDEHAFAIESVSAAEAVAWARLLPERSFASRPARSREAQGRAREAAQRTGEGAWVRLGLTEEQWRRWHWNAHAYPTGSDAAENARL